MIKYGYENTVCGTGGEGTLSPYMYDKLYLKNSFTLILDSDKAGQNAAREVWAKRLGVGRCWNVKLPYDDIRNEKEDVNSFLIKYGKDEFQKFIDNKYQFKIEGVSSLIDTLYKMYAQSDEGIMYSLPWNTINRQLGGGIERKQLVTIGGQPGFGKTSQVLQICHHFATVHKMPSLVTCLEMSEIKLATKIVQLHNDLDYQEIDPNHALVYAKDLEDIPIYFAYSPTITPQIYYNTVREARNRYGCELFVFDNLQLLVRSGEESDIGKATQMFKNTIAMGLDVIMIMVSQPRKLNAEREPTYDDLKGSSSISADSDIILLGRRKRKKEGDGFDAFESKATIIIDKSRFSSGGRSYLEFIGGKSKFVEYKK
jgi:replicative DNA helicase